MRPLLRSRRFDTDLQACVEFYAAEAPHVVGRLLHAVDSTTERIFHHPGIGSSRYASVTGLMDLRSVIVPRFPYTILYTDGNDRINVLRLLHVKRDIPQSLMEDD